MPLQQDQLRFATGAPTIGADPRAVAAARHHASYNAANRTIGHDGGPGHPPGRDGGAVELISAASR
ncbi:MAG TPA: hypothetical protein VFC31_07125 [Candidatus Limnocylindria bacterium]|nr:hypothetical protein [Candidatus Limnocylindria bacterium]